jgi:hypothetical protein
MLCARQEPGPRFPEQPYLRPLPSVRTRRISLSKTDSHDSFERREAQGRSLTLKVPSSVEATNLLRVWALTNILFKNFCQFFEELLTQLWMNPS